jgi:hypothetical protein
MDRPFDRDRIVLGGTPTPEHRSHRFPVDECWRCGLKGVLVIARMEIGLGMEAGAARRPQ